MIENGICGWVALSAGSFDHQGTAARIERAVADRSATRHSLPGQGEAFVYGPDPSRSFAQHQGVAVVIKGRPRWRNPSPGQGPDQVADAAAIIERYARQGAAFLEQLLGRFSLILADSRAPLVLLAVDRMGIERLCFAHTNAALAFGTNAQVVARTASDAPRLNRQALFDYLYREVVPSPETVFASVEKLLPGQCVTFDGKSVRRSFYWRLRYRPRESVPLADLEARFHRLLRDAVTREADRDDVGAFLSGGTDSTTVTGLLTEVRGGPAPTFSIGFSAEGFDEMEYARIAARHFSTQPHEYYVSPRDIVDALPLIARAYDEPFGNASAVPTYLCARLAQQHGIGVLLAGDGGDEIFGGNARYAKQKIFEAYFTLPAWLRAALEPALLNAPGAGVVAPLRKLQSYVRQARIPLPDRLETYNFLHRSPLESIFDPDFLREIDPDHPLEILREVYRRTDSADPVDRMMHLDLKAILADSDLRKVCRMCEVAGIEVRFPMLADELVDFSGEVPAALKVKGTRLRHFFKQALRDFLPPEILTKSKHGFGLPFGLWLATDPGLEELARTTLKSLEGRGIVRSEHIAELWRHHAEVHASYFGVMIWMLVQLELWLQSHVDGRISTA
jgi:asparagine synthase (glutamine-hydrolysing)